MKKTTKPEELLALRKKIKGYKPTFLRQDAHKKKKVPKVWRRPKGLHSKVRENRRGYVRNLTCGYGSPRAVKGLHHSGLQPVLVTHLSQLKTMERAKQGIIVSGRMGDKKKLTVLQEAEKLKIKILNLDPAKFKVQVEEALKQRKEHKKTFDKKKEEKTIEKKVEKPAEKKEETVDEKERKEKERREAEKVLTQKA